MACAPRPTPDRPLAGRHVVVTRPAEQAGALCAAIEARGGVPVAFPVLAIIDLDDVRAIVAVADRLDDYDFAVFISPNAVNKALNVILGRRAWPDRLVAVTVGKSSERELARFGIGRVVSPSGRFDSEALIALPELAAERVAGRRFIIFRGDGGRELLGDTLVARGAKVEYVECYRRGKPNLDAAPLMKLWARGELDAIAVTSSEGLRNLFDMVGPLGQAWLRKTPLFVPHVRIAEQGTQLGLEQMILTGPGDDGLVAGLVSHFSVQGTQP